MKCRNSIAQVLTSGLLVCATAFDVFSQSPQSYAPRNYSVIPPSPEVGSLLQYKEVPVNHFSGLPDISFELFRIAEGSLSVPITLSYHGGGVRMQEREGNAGLGWVVSADASISRTVYGAPDEANGGHWDLHGLFHLDDNEREFRKRLLAQEADFDPTSGEIYADKRSWMAVLGQRHYEGLTDVANDVFQISGLGLSGTFAYNDDQRMVLSTESAIDIEPKQCLSAYPISFVVQNTNGTTYTFSDIEQTRYKYYRGAPELSQREDSVKYISTWHLSSLADACGNKVKFYHDENPGFEWKNSSFADMMTDISNIELKEYTPSSVNSISVITYYPRLLRKIESSGVTVEFDYEIFANGAFRKKLIKTITVKTKNSETPVKKFDFIYTDIHHFGYSTSASEFHCFWKVLNEVRENGKAIYKFDYYTDSISQFHNDFTACDFGGYFNGMNNGSLIPLYSNYPSGGANRSVNPEASISASLKTIHYPTGGSTTIIWESNEYGYVKDLKISHSINDDIIAGSSTETIRMCIDNAYKKLKITNFIVNEGDQVRLDLTKYFLMNPQNLMTTDYEHLHEYDLTNYPSVSPPDYPHITIRKASDNSLVGVYFIDKNTVETKFHNEPIPLYLSTGTYNFELLSPTSVKGAEDLLEREFMYGDCIAGRIHIIKDKHLWTEGSGEAITKDYWCGLRVKRIISQTDESEEPIIKEYLYGDLDPKKSSGTVQMLPSYHHMYYMVCPSPMVPGQDGTEVYNNSSIAFPNSPMGNIAQVQYPKVTTRLTLPDRFEPNGYLNYCAENYQYTSSMESGNSDYNMTAFLTFQPVGARMFTSKTHRRGNLLLKSVGNGYNVNSGIKTAFSYNIFEPEQLDTLATEVFTLCDFTHYNGINGGYGTHCYGIGRYAIIPFNKTIATETTTEESGFSYSKNYRYFYDAFTERPDYNLVKCESTINSEGEEEKTYYTYLKAGKYYSALVETEVKTCNGQIVGAKRNEYDPKTLLLKKEYTLNDLPTDSGSLLSNNQETTVTQKKLISKPEYEYRYNSRGNVVEISFNGTILASYLWGYYGQYPIIEIKGIGYDELVGVAAKAGFDQRSVLDGELFSAPQVKRLANAVRNEFPEADVSSLTYHWLIGIMESTDSRGVSTSFSYDKQGRLTDVRDMNDKLIKRYEYHDAWEGVLE